jgi:hypothetical protein
MTDEKYKWQVIGVSVIVSITALLTIGLVYVMKSFNGLVGVFFFLTVFFIPTEEAKEDEVSETKCPECGSEMVRCAECGHEVKISEEEG